MEEYDKSIYRKVEMQGDSSLTTFAEASVVKALGMTGILDSQGGRRAGSRFYYYYLMNLHREPAPLPPIQQKSTVISNEVPPCGTK